MEDLRKFAPALLFNLLNSLERNMIKGEKSQKLDKFSHVVFCNVLKPNFLPILYRPAL